MADRNIGKCQKSDVTTHVGKQNSPRLGHGILRHHIWGYSVCLCPIKKTPSLYGLSRSKMKGTQLNEMELVYCCLFLHGFVQILISIIGILLVNHVSCFI